jgi:hypothetical protein
MDFWASWQGNAWYSWLNGLAGSRNTQQLALLLTNTSKIASFVQALSSEEVGRILAVQMKVLQLLLYSLLGSHRPTTVTVAMRLAWALILKLSPLSLGDLWCQHVLDSLSKLGCNSFMLWYLRVVLLSTPLVRAIITRNAKRRCRYLPVVSRTQVTFSQRYIVVFAVHWASAVLRSSSNQSWTSGREYDDKHSVKEAPQDVRNLERCDYSAILGSSIQKGGKGGNRSMSIKGR